MDILVNIIYYSYIRVSCREAPMSEVLKMRKSPHKLPLARAVEV
jgi:hypothetical protein